MIVSAFNTLNGVGSGIISLQTSDANPNPHQRSAITIAAQSNRASVQRSAIITIAGEGTDPISNGIVYNQRLINR